MLTGALPRLTQCRRDEVEPIETADVAAEPPDEVDTRQLNGQLRRLHQVDDTNGAASLEFRLAGLSGRISL